VEGLSDGTVFTVSSNATNGTASIDPATGLWSYQPTADWYGTDSFTVTITDDAGNSSTQVISVTVTPVNDAPTDLSLSAISIAENAATGTVVGTVTSTDPDAGDTKTYSLTDTAGGRFAINASTGVITVADGSLLNYEAAASHTLTVQVTDSGGQSYTEQFTINLTNVNEGPSDLQKEIGGGSSFLHQDRSATLEGIGRVPFSSRMEHAISEGEGRVPDDLRKPVEWNSQPIPKPDVPNSGRNMSAGVPEGEWTPPVSSTPDETMSPSLGRHEDAVVSLDSATQGDSDVGPVSWPPSEDVESVPEEPSNLSLPIGLGLVGAALQGSLGKKEKVTTLNAQAPSQDQPPTKEQKAHQPSADEKEPPPSQR